MLKLVQEIFADENRFMRSFNLSSNSQRVMQISDEKNEILIRLNDENFKVVWCFMLEQYEQHKSMPISKNIDNRAFEFTVDYILAHPREAWKPGYIHIFKRRTLNEFFEQKLSVRQKFINIIPYIPQSNAEIRTEMFTLFVLNSFLFHDQPTTIEQISKMLLYTITTPAYYETKTAVRIRPTCEYLFMNMKPFERYAPVWDCLLQNPLALGCINQELAEWFCEDAHNTINFLKNSDSIANFIALAIKARMLNIPFNLISEERKAAARLAKSLDLDVAWICSPESNLNEVLNPLINYTYPEIRSKLEHLLSLESRSHQSLSRFPEKNEIRMTRIAAILNFLLQAYIVKALYDRDLASSPLKNIVNDKIFSNCLLSLQKIQPESYDFSAIMDLLVSLFKDCKNNFPGTLELAKQCYTACQTGEVSGKKYQQMISKLDRDLIVFDDKLPIFLAKHIDNGTFDAIGDRGYIQAQLYAASSAHGLAATHFFNFFNKSKQSNLLHDCYEELYLYLYNRKVKVRLNAGLKFESIVYTGDANFSGEAAQEDLFFNAIILFALLDGLKLKDMAVKEGEIINLLNGGAIGESNRKLELSYDNFIKMDNFLNSINDKIIFKFSKKNFMMRLFGYGFIKEKDLIALTVSQQVDLENKMEAIWSKLSTKLLKTIVVAQREYISTIENKLINQVPKSKPPIFWQELVSRRSENKAEQDINPDQDVDNMFTA